MKSKVELRQQIKQKLSDLGRTSPREFLPLLQNLRNLKELWAVQTLAAYLPIGAEPDLRTFLKEWLLDKRRLLLPRYDSSAGCYELAAVSDIERDTVRGYYGILEPSPLLYKVILSADTPGAWLVPGLAFSRTGTRLGRGAGYYDRLLAPSTALKIGVCLDCQLMTGIPLQKHDVKMHCIVTETRIVKCQELAGELAQ
ncbi:MAG: 5-formyltetrahydrofolate cyclo-ligase [Lentisphaeria bacterium]